MTEHDKKQKEKEKEVADLKKASLLKRRGTVMFGANGPLGLSGSGPPKLLSYDKGETPILGKQLSI